MHPLSCRCKCTHTHDSITQARSFSLPPSVRCQKRISLSPPDSKNSKTIIMQSCCRSCQIRTSAKDHHAHRVCFQIPHLWAKKGGTCKATADISSPRQAAHFRVCRRLSRDLRFHFHSRIICDCINVSDGGFSQEVMSKLPAAWFMEEWASHGQSDEKWRYEKACLACLAFFYLTYLHVIWILSGRSTIMRQWALVSALSKISTPGIRLQIPSWTGFHIS